MSNDYADGYQAMLDADYDDYRATIASNINIDNPWSY